MVIHLMICTSKLTFNSIVLFFSAGPPAERRPGLAGLSGRWRGAVLAARSLRRADLPWRHTGGGQSDDALIGFWGGGTDRSRDMLLNDHEPGETALPLSSSSGPDGENASPRQRVPSHYLHTRTWESRQWCLAFSGGYASTYRQMCNVVFYITLKQINNFPLLRSTTFILITSAEPFRAVHVFIRINTSFCHLHFQIYT